MIAKLVVCASGEGSNFEAIVEASRMGRLAADVAGLIVSRGKIGAIARAERLRIPVKQLSPKAFASVEEWDAAVRTALGVWRADWVVLAGFLTRIGPQVLAAYPGRIVNSHPSLLPKYGGAGMYGDFVHQAVVSAGERETGVTIHTIDAEYDRGRVLAQGRVEVLADDTAASLAARVKAFEVGFYPKVLNDLVTGRLPSG
jgi:phosphoribosylglycinamide formyltransferase-1